jgi:hypothetical protein
MNPLIRALCASAALMAAAPAAEAVTFGVPDGTGHPHVVNLLFRQGPYLYSCSGTLMSPTVVMTAGHCTEEGGVANPNTWVTADPVIDIPPSGCHGDVACFNTYMDNLPGWHKGTANPHPNYDDFSQFPATFDVGIIVLDTPMQAATYGTLPPLGFLETIKKAKDDNFTVVGYGLQGYNPHWYSEIWARYVGTVKLVTTNSAYNGGYSAKFTNNPGTGGGTCYGDSGGPIFYKDTNVVVAIVSFGITPCIGIDFNFRTDIQTTQDFVDSFLD